MSGEMFSGFIEANQGFNSPVSFSGPQGWTVFKQMQTEVYVVTHNLGIRDPKVHFHVTVTTDTPFIIPFVTVAENGFKVTTWQLWGNAPQAPIPAATNFCFIARYLA